MAQRSYQTGDKVRLDAVDIELTVLSATFQENGRNMVKVAMTKDGFTFETVLPTVFLKET